ncbi:MAG: dimethylamine corrinoid protein 3 [Firmicutes bacterium]|nr:dimethylamine corrinoid protein 3 [Bacillota bacterium]
MTETNDLLKKVIESVIGGDEAAAEALARQALEQKMDPLQVINEGYVVGIKQVGDLFECGELFLPELIQAAEAVKKATELLNSAITGGAESSKGKVLIATVEGDIHDIGKAIVVSLLVANGFNVLDLGRDVPTLDIIAKAEEFKADVIGTSALLTTTMVKQKELEETLVKEGLKSKYKTIVGGAPVTVRWAEKIGADAYAENAGEGVNKIIKLISGS